MLEETDKGNDTPSLDNRLCLGSSGYNPIRNNQAASLLNQFLQNIYNVGEDAQEIYEELLKKLQGQAESVIVEIVRAEGASDQDDYPFRWALVHTAAELKHPATLHFLKNLVLTPIPSERSEDPHSFSTVAEETIIRTTAVEGIEYLAKKGNSKANSALLEFLKIPSLSIRRAAVQAILATTAKKDIRKRLVALLPKEQHYLLDIKRIDVRKAPQIEEPERHLTEAARKRVTKPPPRILEKTKEDAPRVHPREEQ
jgi:hypothetical protein